MTPELEELIRILARQAAHRYGYEPEDAFQEAQIVALRAVRTHDPSLGPLGPRVRYLVTQRLAESVHWRLRSCVKDRQRQHAPAEQLCALRGRPQSPHFLTDLFDELSEDAAAIVRIVLDTPGYVLRDEDLPGRSSRRFLKSYLERIGWPSNRINSSFREIQEALCQPNS